jgi:rhamnose utilization protein RhaD (predicted bifunctional aldolase and dehydrogenase)
MENLDRLIGISRYYGENPAYVIAGGGNTSYKDQDTIWIKASGIPLAGIGRDGFVALSRNKLSLIESGVFSENAEEREEQVKVLLNSAILSPNNLRPSVETSLHNLIGYAFVVHTHPTLVNGLMCANDAMAEVEQRFGREALMVEYTDPGYILFKKLRERITDYIADQGHTPQIIFLQNHGVFVAADTVEEINRLYADINKKISQGKDISLPSVETAEFSSPVTIELERYVSSRSLCSRTLYCDLIGYFTGNRVTMDTVSSPFSPDIIVYCKSSYLLLERDMDPDRVTVLVEKFEAQNGYFPRVILEEGGGLTVVEENTRSLQTVEEVFLDLMKISYLSRQYGGPHFMTPGQISFIDNWEVEHYRRKIAKGEQE